MRSIFSLALLAAFAVSTSSVFAQPATETPANQDGVQQDSAQSSGETCTKENSDGGQCTAAQGDSAQCDGSGTCPLAAAMEAFPKMEYVVGEQRVCCATKAAELAEDAEGTVQFAVGEQTFDDKAAAMAALADTSEAFVTEFLTPSTCAKSGKISFAGQSCGCAVKSAARVKAVTDATNAIKVAYRVGEQSACCAKSAGAIAKKTGEPIQFVVGDDQFDCQFCARIAASKAKYATAVQTLAGLTAPASATTTETEAAPQE